MIEQAVVAHAVTVDCNDPAMRARALTLVQGLLDIWGIAGAAAMLLVGAEMLLTTVLHQPTPIPAANVQSVVTLLTDLTARVLAHRDCAERMAAEAAGDDELPPAPVH